MVGVLDANTESSLDMDICDNNDCNSTSCGEGGGGAFSKEPAAVRVLVLPACPCTCTFFTADTLAASASFLVWSCLSNDDFGVLAVRVLAVRVLAVRVLAVRVVPTVRAAEVRKFNFLSEVKEGEDFVFSAVAIFFRKMVVHTCADAVARTRSRTSARAHPRAGIG